MSHQTKYKSKFVNMDMLRQAFERRGFKLQSEFNSDVQAVFLHPKAHPVYVTQAADASIQISSDLDYGPRSQMIKKLLGSPENEYEHLATTYNEIMLTRHFEAQGHTVETQQGQDGELMLTVSVGEWS